MSEALTFVQLILLHEMLGDIIANTLHPHNIINCHIEKNTAHVFDALFMLFIVVLDIIASVSYMQFYIQY